MDDLSDLTPHYEQRLRFLVRFVRMNLDSTRPGDWLNLRDDLAKFLDIRTIAHGDLIAGQIEPPLPGEYPDEALRSLQDEVKTLLSQATRLVCEQKEAWPFVENLSLVPVSARFAIGRNFGDFILLAASGPVRDVFLLITLFLLSRAPIAPLAECPECGNIFYRKDKRQKFCEHRCANLASTKRFYARKKAKKGKKKK